MNNFPIGTNVTVTAGVNRGNGKIVGERTSDNRQQVRFENGQVHSIAVDWIAPDGAPVLTESEVTDRLAARAVRNADLGNNSHFVEGLMVAWEMVTGADKIDDADVHEMLHAAAARHNARQAVSA